MDRKIVLGLIIGIMSISTVAVIAKENTAYAYDGKTYKQALGNPVDENGKVVDLETVKSSNDSVDELEENINSNSTSEEVNKEERISISYLEDSIKSIHDNYIEGKIQIANCKAYKTMSILVKAGSKEKYYDFSETELKKIKAGEEVSFIMSNLESNTDYEVQVLGDSKVIKEVGRIHTDKSKPYVSKASIKSIDSDSIQFNIRVEDEDASLVNGASLVVYEKVGESYNKKGEVNIEGKSIEVVDGEDYGMGAINLNNKDNIYYGVSGEYELSEGEVNDNEYKLLADNYGNNIYANLELFDEADTILNTKVSIENISEDIRGDKVTLNIEIANCKEGKEYNKVERISSVEVSLRDMVTWDMKSYNLNKKEIAAIKDGNKARISIEGLSAGHSYSVRVKILDETGEELRTNIDDTSVRIVSMDKEEVQGEIKVKEVGYSDAIFEVHIDDNGVKLDNLEVVVFNSQGKQELEQEVVGEEVRIEGLKGNEEYEVQLVGDYNLDAPRYNTAINTKEISSVNISTSSEKKKPTVSIGENSSYDLLGDSLTLDYIVNDEDNTLLNQNISIVIKHGNKSQEVKRTINIGIEDEVHVENLGVVVGENIEVEINGSYDLNGDGKADGGLIGSQEIKLPEVIESEGDAYIGVDTCSTMMAADGGIGDGIKFEAGYNYMLGGDVDCIEEEVTEDIQMNNGIIDGAGHEVQNVGLNMEGTNNVGMVGINNGTIKNMTITNPIVVGKDGTGFVSGTNKGEISGVTIQIDEGIEKNATRMMGKTKDGEKTEDNCHDINTGGEECREGGFLQGAYYVGGIAGVNEGSVVDGEVIANETYINDHTSILGKDKGTGGIVGWNKSGGEVKNSKVSGVSIYANNNTGGIVGKNDGKTKDSHVSNTHIEAYGDDNGGVVGENYGTVSGNHFINSEIYGNSELGGIAGVTHSEVSGNEVSGSTISANKANDKLGEKYYAVGGIVGSNYKGSVTDNIIKEESKVIGDVNTKSLGGIAGLNVGNLDNNSATNIVVTGKNTVGGIVGENQSDTKNNEIKGSSIEGESEVGGIVGENNGFIDNNSVSGEGSEVKDIYEGAGGTEIGGIAGVNTKTIYTTNEIKNTTILGQNNVGGAVGYNQGEIKSKTEDGKDILSVQNVKIKGNIDVGGVAGFNASNITSVKVRNSTVNGQSDVGGIVGYNDGLYASSTVLNSKFENSIVKGTERIGGIVGYNDVGCTVEKSYVSSSSEVGNYNVGGLIGKNYGSINTSYSRNLIVYGINNIGGIVGENEGKIDNSYSAGNSITGDEINIGLNSSNIGGIAGENYGGIDHTYSTSYVEGYEYVGGLVGHQGEPGYLTSSFYDNTQNRDMDMSKGALEIIGQDRRAMELINSMEESEKTPTDFYEELEGTGECDWPNFDEGDEKCIIQEAYKVDTQDWYLNGAVGIRTEDNVIVLNQEEYADYINVGGISKGMKKKIGVMLAKKTLGGLIASIVDELNETRVNSKVIMVLPYYDIYGYTEGELPDGTIVRTYTLEKYGFENTIWDYSSLNENTIGESEPIRLKGM